MPAGGTVSCATPADGITAVDENTFADVRERMAEQEAREPAAETDADRYFESAVNAFEQGSYAEAAEDFYQAMQLEPEDIILAFAYAQALFADSQYAGAAEVLREAMGNIQPGKEGVFFPRGLYTEDDQLFEQIDSLGEETQTYSFDADLQFLLGYQLMGIGSYDEAVEALEQASLDYEYSAVSGKLIELIEKIKSEQTPDASVSS